jgi:hypothetical protein
MSDRISFQSALGSVSSSLRGGPDATEAGKNLLDQNITQVTEIRRLGRGQSIGSRCDKFQRAPRLKFQRLRPRINRSIAVNGSGSSDTYRPWHSKLRRGRIEFIAP